MCFDGLGYASADYIPLPTILDNLIADGNIPPLIGRPTRLSGPMMLVWRGLDHHISDEQRRAVVTGMREANKVFVDVVFSNADHGFFCDARASYQPEAAGQAWSLTNEFFDTYLGANA